MEQMDVEQSPAATDGVTVFKLTGPFTLSTMFGFQSALRDPALNGVIIDLSEVPYMDSAGLGVLLGHWSHAQRHAQKFALVGLSDRVRTIFEITHTDQVLPIFRTQADAENNWARAAAV